MSDKTQRILLFFVGLFMFVLIAHSCSVKSEKQRNLDGAPKAAAMLLTHLKIDFTAISCQPQHEPYVKLANKDYTLAMCNYANSAGVRTHLLCDANRCQPDNP